MEVILEIKSDNEIRSFVDRLKLSAIFCKYDPAFSVIGVV
jgi:hypothetical protein